MPSATLVTVFLCAVSVVGWVLASLFLAALIATRKDRDRWFNGLEGQRTEMRRLDAALEQIENLGPRLTADQYAANVGARFAGKPLPHSMPPCKLWVPSGFGLMGSENRTNAAPL